VCKKVAKDAILVQQIDAVKPTDLKVKSKVFSLTFLYHCDIQNPLIADPASDLYLYRLTRPYDC
jgi:hypothetical protein